MTSWTHGLLFLGPGTHAQKVYYCESLCPYGLILCSQLLWSLLLHFLPPLEDMLKLEYISYQKRLKLKKSSIVHSFWLLYYRNSH